MMIDRTKRKQGRVLPLWITLVLILLLNSLPAVRGEDTPDLRLFAQHLAATASGHTQGAQYFPGDELPESWAAARAEGQGYNEGPGHVFTRHLEQTVQYGFNVTTAYTFPPGFEFATDNPVAELRATVRLTQIYFRRLMAADWPEAYEMVECTFDGGIVDSTQVGFPFILLNVLSTFTFRLVGTIPTSADTIQSLIPNNLLFLNGAAVPPALTDPNGWDPRDYANFTRVEGEAIFGNIVEATVIFVARLPTMQPSQTPSMLPSQRPTSMPSARPSSRPTASPSMNPSPSTPTISESPSTSSQPSNMPVPSPSTSPSGRPSTSPSDQPSRLPTRMPSETPSGRPSSQPSDADFAFTATNQNIMSAEDYNIISGAFAQLNDIMTGDLTNQATSGTAITFNPNARVCNIPTTVDDLHICISYNVDLIDSNVLGRAGILEVRGATDTNPNLPYVSAMDLAPNLRSRFTDDQFRAIVRHEALHCMGVGILWPTFNLVQNDNTENCQYRPDTNAGREFQTITGCNVNFAIPLQPTICSHWEQDCFGSRELMNPEFDEDEALPALSRVTIGSLQDMGYTVDITKGDALTDEDFSSECMCSESLTASLKFQYQPQISPDALAEATASGKQYLAEMKSIYEASASYQATTETLNADGSEEFQMSGGSQFVGHKAVSVLIKDGEYVREVIVRA